MGNNTLGIGVAVGGTAVAVGGRAVAVGIDIVSVGNVVETGNGVGDAQPYVIDNRSKTGRKNKDTLFIFFLS